MRFSRVIDFGMKLKHLSDQELLSQTQAAVARERAATTEVLYHLLEVEVRMLYAQLGFSTLFEYVRLEPP